MKSESQGLVLWEAAGKCAGPGRKHPSEILGAIASHSLTFLAFTCSSATPLIRRLEEKNRECISVVMCNRVRL